MSVEGQICRHCRRPFFNKNARRQRRGMCYRCFNTTEIRSLYPPNDGNRGVELGNETPEPTCAQPGSPSKVRVLQQRAGSGQQLWHPLDFGMSNVDYEEWLA